MPITGKIFSWGSNKYGQLGDYTKYSTLTGLYPDVFEDAVIADYWTQQDLGGGGSFTEAASAGYLTITAGAGSQSSATFTPTWVYQIVNESDFIVTAKIYHVDTINQNSEQAGLVVAESSSAASKKAGLRVIYSGFKYLNCYHFDATLNNNRNFDGTGADPLINVSPIWMRISRTNGVIECSYSIDGINFVDANPETGFLITSSEPLYIGLWAAQAGSGTPFNVSFSDFDVVPAVDPQAVELVGDLNLIDIAGGRNHSLGLNYDGKVYAWGDNTYGQLGDGTNISKSSPVAVQGNRKFVEVSSSADHSMAIDINGVLWGWGRNDYGQLGFVAPSGATPEELGEQGALIEYSQELTYPWLTKGSESAGFILEKSTGQAWTWGQQTLGSLGANISGNQSSPLSVYGGHIFLDIGNGGNYFNIAVDATGDLWAWGYCSYNNYHRCGIGALVNTSTPRAVLPLPGGVKVMRPGTDLMCNSCGKKGIVDAGSNHSLAIGEDGTLYGWGYNNYGQLGRGNTNSVTSPIALPLWGKVGHVSAEYDNTFTIGWSDNLLGREEVPDWGYRIRGVQTRGILMAAGAQWKVPDWDNVHRSSPVTCCAPYEMPVPYLIQGLLDYQCEQGWYVTHVDQGQNFACASDIGKSGGRIFCWGYNDYNQLGDTTGNWTSAPVAVAGPINDNSGWKDFSCGYRHTCALRASDGTAWCWGWNTYGQLGDNTRTQRNSPKSVVGGRSFVTIICAANSTFALDEDGLLWGWGFPYGNFRSTSFSSPVSVLAVQGKTSPYFPADEAQYLLGFLSNQASPRSIGRFETAAAGLYHSLGIDSTGSVWAWGRNNKGQLGVGDLINRSSPVAVTGLPSKKYVKVAAGAEHSLALAQDGQVYAWGDNTFTQASTAAGIDIGAGGGGTEAAIEVPGQQEIITPDWYTDFSQYTEYSGYCCWDGGITFSLGFFCQYGTHPCFGPGLGFSNDWEHGQYPNGEWTIIDPGDFGTTNKFGPVTARRKHSGATNDNIIANRILDNYEDQDILALMKLHGDESYHDFLHICGRVKDISQTTNTYYRFAFNHGNDGGVRMMKIVNGSFTSLGEMLVPRHCVFCVENPGHHRCPGYNTDTGVYVPLQGNLWRNGDWMWIRLRIQGNILKGKAWPYGYPMPRGWDMIIEDNDITGAGTWGFGADWGMLADTAGFVDWIGVAVNGKEIIRTIGVDTGDEIPILPSGGEVPASGQDFIDIDAGGYHNIALDSNYKVWAWGRNDYGQLGVNSLDQKSTPTSVYGDHTFIDFAAGEMHTYALKKDGTICTWGAGEYGKLLHHTDQSARSIPHCGAIGAEECVNLLPNTGNYLHSTLLKCTTSWQAWAWGCNTDGKLGDGTITNRRSPVQVIGNKKWIDMSGGGDFTLGIDEDGKIWAWGDDALGQLGDG